MSSFDAWLEPFFFVVDPSKRLFFIYLLSSVLIGVLVLYRQNGGSGLQAFENLINPKVWFHRSSRVDFQLLVFNSLLRTFLFFFVLVNSLWVSKVVMRQLVACWPSHQAWNVSYQEGLLAYAIVSFVVLDFARFFQHYLFHKIPFLWRFHKVHHTAEVMTPVTLYRTHPIESLVSAFRRIFVIGLISGVFLFTTQSVIGPFAIFGVNALDFAFNFLGSNLRHSHVWLSFGPLNYFFVSPAQHQIHHSRAEKHHDKNLGFALSIWDQLFGTFYQVRHKEFLIFGVRGEKHLNLLTALKAPFRSVKLNKSKTL